jgi:hypothetical protein
VIRRILTVGQELKKEIPGHMIFIGETVTFLKQFAIGFELTVPILLSLVAIVALLGRAVGAMEGWSHFGSFYLGVSPVNWGINWTYGLPLIVLTVLIHVFGLGLIRHRIVKVTGSTIHRRHPTAVFTVAMGATTLFATSLHALEAGIWAIAYRVLGALPDSKSAMLYSLNAMTSYGHTGLNLNLGDRWHLLGALEALNGWLLFGVSTAFLFAVMEKVRSFDSK